MTDPQQAEKPITLELELAGLRVSLFAGIQHADPETREAVWSLLDDLHISAGAFEHTYRAELIPLVAPLCSRCGLAERAPCHEAQV